jgi:hypothetical protein
LHTKPLKHGGASGVRKGLEHLSLALPLGLMNGASSAHPLNFRRDFLGCTSVEFHQGGPCPSPSIVRQRKTIKDFD